MSTVVLGTFLLQHGDKTAHSGYLISVDKDAVACELASRLTVGLPVVVACLDAMATPGGHAFHPVHPYHLVYLDGADVGTDGFEEHTLYVAQRMVPHITTDGMILIDDTVPDGDGWRGKGRLAVPWLVANGWKVIYSGYQVLLVRQQATH